MRTPTVGSIISRQMIAAITGAIMSGTISNRSSRRLTMRRARQQQCHADTEQGLDHGRRHGELRGKERRLEEFWVREDILEILEPDPARAIRPVSPIVLKRVDRAEHEWVENPDRQRDRGQDEQVRASTASPGGKRAGA